MTKSEFEGWKQVTAASRLHWQIDAVQVENHGRYLIYKGGENGHFICIEKDGQVTLGTYEGALPCITDACFKTQHTRQFPNQNEAWKTLIERAGLNFLLDVVGCRAYPTALQPANLRPARKA